MGARRTTPLRRAFLAPAMAFALAGQPAVAEENRAPLPGFVLAQYQGAAVDFADYRGRVVLVNFWATWCAPCVAEFPALVALKATFKDAPFEILAVNLGEPDSAIAAFIGALDAGVNFPILLDRAGAVAASWRAPVLPTTVLADKGGNRALEVHGERDWDGEAARAAVRRLLHE